MAGDHYILSYLGCVVDEHGNCKRMVDGIANAGARALSDWLRKCGTSIGEIKGVPFKGLLEVLDSVLLYGVEVWGCTRQLGLIENVQMGAAKI